MLETMPLRIEDYALIGDCETAALVGRDGSIDWLCMPRFDSPACFSALLGTQDHGHWLVAPAIPARAVRRRYRPGTLILETEFETDAGVVVVTDCMPLRTQMPDLIRVGEGKRGAVPMRLELVIRLDYGSLVPWVRRTPDGIKAVGGSNALHLRTPSSSAGRGLPDRGGVHGFGWPSRGVHPDVVSVALLFAADGVGPETIAAVHHDVVGLDPRAEDLLDDGIHRRPRFDEDEDLARLPERGDELG